MTFLTSLLKVRQHPTYPVTHNHLHLRVLQSNFPPCQLSPERINSVVQPSPPTSAASDHDDITNISSATPNSNHVPSNTTEVENVDQLKRKEFREHWINQFNQDQPWDVFSNLCVQFAEKGIKLVKSIANPSSSRPQPRRPDRPSARPPHGNFRPRFDKGDAQRIQQLYRHSKKRAARKILEPESLFYTGSTQSADDFFRQIFASKPCDTTSLRDALNTHVPAAPPDENLFCYPTPEEIKTKIRSCANTSPGPDRIDYCQLKSIDPSCVILAAIFQNLHLKS